MPRPENQKCKEYAGDSSQGIRYPPVPLWGSKNEVVAPKWRFQNTILKCDLTKSHFGADFLESAPILLLARTFTQKLCSGNGVKVQLPNFLSPREALEGTLCLVRNLLRILYIFGFQVLASRSHSKGCFSFPKKL